MREQRHQRDLAAILHRGEVEQLVDADRSRSREDDLGLGLQQRPNPLAILGEIHVEHARGLAAAGERFRNSAHDQEHVRLDRV